MYTVYPYIQPPLLVALRGLGADAARRRRATRTVERDDDDDDGGGGHRRRDMGGFDATAVERGGDGGGDVGARPDVTVKVGYALTAKKASRMLSDALVARCRCVWEEDDDGAMRVRFAFVSCASRCGARDDDDDDVTSGRGGGGGARRRENETRDD